MSIELHWIQFSEDGKQLYNFPTTDDDIVYKVGDSYYVGYYDNDQDNEGFCSNDGERYHECDSVLWWVYCKDLE